jgi:hypothetical protein
MIIAIDPVWIDCSLRSPTALRIGSRPLNSNLPTMPTLSRPVAVSPARIVRTVSNWQEVAEYTRSLLNSKAGVETAKCARGRQNLWLQAEPNYANGTYTSGVHDDRLWSFLQRLAPDADLAQVFGGNVAIDWHRDAAYAHSKAWLFALGKSTFQIESREIKSRSGEIITPSEVFSFDLTGGELLEFDCKCRHRATNVDPQRIGIGLWSAKIPLPV